MTAVDVVSEIEIARRRDRRRRLRVRSRPRDGVVREHQVRRVAVAAAARDGVAAGVRGLVPRTPAAYTYEVRELVPGERFVMGTAEGPFPMETTYAFADAGPGLTRMTLRNRGEPSGFAKVAGPVMARAMRRANGKDLRRLRDILERRAAP